VGPPLSFVLGKFGARQFGDVFDQADVVDEVALAGIVVPNGDNCRELFLPDVRLHTFDDFLGHVEALVGPRTGETVHLKRGLPEQPFALLNFLLCSSKVILLPGFLGLGLVV